MAADVDKTSPEDGSKNSPQRGHQSPGSGSWISKGLWTLLLVGAVPLLAFGIKYYQDAQFIKRHVRERESHICSNYTHVSKNIFLTLCLKNKKQLEE